MKERTKSIIAKLAVIIFIAAFLSAMAIYLYGWQSTLTSSIPTYPKQLTIIIQNGTCDVVYPSQIVTFSYNNGTEGSYILGSPLYSNTNYTEAIQWALNYTQEK